MLIYVGERSCLKLYEGVKNIDDVIARLERQLDEFRQMKKADVDAVDLQDQEQGSLWLTALEPTTVEKFGLNEFDDGLDGDLDDEDPDDEESDSDVRESTTAAR